MVVALPGGRYLGVPFSLKVRRELSAGGEQEIFGVVIPQQRKRRVLLSGAQALEPLFYRQLRRTAVKGYPAVVKAFAPKRRVAFQRLAESTFRQLSGLCPDILIFCARPEIYVYHRTLCITYHERSTLKAKLSVTLPHRKRDRKVRISLKFAVYGKAALLRKHFQPAARILRTLKAHLQLRRLVGDELIADAAVLLFGRRKAAPRHAPFSAHIFRAVQRLVQLERPEIRRDVFGSIRALNYDISRGLIRVHPSRLAGDASLSGNQLIAKPRTLMIFSREQQLPHLRKLLRRDRLHLSVGVYAAVEQLVVERYPPVKLSVYHSGDPSVSNGKTVFPLALSAFGIDYILVQHNNSFQS